MSLAKMERLFKNSSTTIINDDVLLGLDLIEKASVDLIFADPPYNIGKRFESMNDKWPSEKEYADWFEQWLVKCIEKLSPSGSLYVMTSTQALSRIDLIVSKHLNVLSRIIWHYDSSGVQAKKYFGSLWEPIIHAVVNKKSYCFNADDIRVDAKTGSKRKLIDYRGETPKPYNTTKVPGNVWYFPRVRYRMPEYVNHPTQKPEALLERIIKASSNEGDTVLDPFAGTFTTCAVAQRLGRKSIGIELSREYTGIGLRRLGIADKLDGKALKSIQKTTKRVNGKKNMSTVDELQLDLK